MSKVNNQRMKLRIEYSRETNLICSDNIPAYADWLEKRLSNKDDETKENMDIKEYLQKEHKGFYKIIEESLTLERRKQFYDAINDFKLKQKQSNETNINHSV